MTTLELLICYIALGLGLGGSALFSGLETGTYLVNRVRLHVLAATPHTNAAVLQQLVSRPNRLLGTLLVANNFANYTASLALAALLADAGYQNWTQIAINAAILTPLLLIFGEVLPKDLFRAHSDHLTYPLARPLLWIQRLLIVTGVVPLIDALSAALGKLLAAHNGSHPMLHPRRVVNQLIKEGVGYGVISPYQSEMIERVLELDRVTIRDVMVPWNQATCVKVDESAQALWALADRVPFARLPLLDDDGRPIGLIDLYDVLLHPPAQCPPLTDLAHSLPQVDADLTLRAAITHLQQAKCTMAVVVEDDRPVGLITTKDLVEPIVGELDIW